MLDASSGGTIEETPKTEAMSREGKGTQAAGEAGRSQPLPW